MILIILKKKKGILEAIKFLDMKYMNDLYIDFRYHLSVVCIHEVNPQRQTVDLKGIFKMHLNESKEKKYRLYRRYVDFTGNKVLTKLTEIDKRSDKSVFVVSIFFLFKKFYSITLFLIRFNLGSLEKSKCMDSSFFNYENRAI